MLSVDHPLEVSCSGPAASSGNDRGKARFLPLADHPLDFGTTRRTLVTLYKRGTVFWSYIWVDGTRYARSTKTGNRRLAETIDQNHAEELRLKNTQCPELKPDMLFAELAARFLGSGGAKEWHRDRLKVLLP